MNTSRDDGSDEGGWLYLLGRVAWRLVQALLVTAGVVAIFWVVGPRGGDTKEKAYIATMKSDLRNLATAEEAYFADYQAYAPSLEAFGPNFYQASTGSTVVIDRATAEGFAASATHSQTRYHCAIFVGPMPPPRAGAQQGVPLCWKP